LVQPLGFANHRTRTLQDVATTINEDHGGVVPQDLEALKKPWRVGPYSARATLLFAFNVPTTLVDQNFARVFSRVFDYSMPSQPHKDDQVRRLIEGVTPMKSGLARAFNLAILDLGALICEPSSPSCMRCPLERICTFATER
jgi:A/G-specific adenine glycosylase